MSKSLYSKAQLESLNHILKNPRIRFLIVATSEPLVSFSSKEMDQLEKLPNENRERVDLSERSARMKILDLVFDWKRNDVKNRDVVLVTESCTVSFETTIVEKDSTNQIRQIAPGPMICSSREFLPKCQGCIGNGKYSYIHKVVNKAEQTYAVLSLQPENPTGPSKMVHPSTFYDSCTPWPFWPKVRLDVNWYGTQGTVFKSLPNNIILRPVLGKITSTSATFLCEVDTEERQHVTTTLIDTIDGQTWTQTLSYDRFTRLMSFVFENLRPARSYTVLLEGYIYCGKFSFFFSFLTFLFFLFFCFLRTWFTSIFFFFSFLIYQRSQQHPSQLVLG